MTRLFVLTNNNQSLGLDKEPGRGTWFSHPIHLREYPQSSPWNLPFILNTFNWGLFESIDTASIQYLSWKTFSRWVGIGPVSQRDSVCFYCFPRFGEGYSNITFRYDPTDYRPDRHSSHPQGWGLGPSCTYIWLFRWYFKKGWASACWASVGVCSFPGKELPATKIIPFLKPCLFYFWLKEPLS